MVCQTSSINRFYLPVCNVCPSKPSSSKPFADKPDYAGSDSEPGPLTESGDDDGGDDDLFETGGFLDLLMQRRRYWSDNLPEGAPRWDFKVKVRGGEWCEAHTGLPYNEMRGEAVNMAVQWCGLYRLRKTSTFSIALYTEEIAHSLAVIWCFSLNSYMGP